MLVIRLQRTGRENLPSYRLVVAEKARPVKGKSLELLGHYLPARNPSVFEKDDVRIEYWISKGAIPSETVARLLRNAGLKNMDKFISTYTKKRSKKDPPPEAAPAPAPAPKPAPVVETPVETPAAPVVEPPAPAAEAPVEAPAAPVAEAPASASDSAA